MFSVGSISPKESTYSCEKPNGNWSRRECPKNTWFNLRRSLGQTSPSLAAFGSGQAAAWKMFSVIERKPPIDSQDESGMTLPAVKGDIQLSTVHFSYPARPDVQIFK
jgi:hypothetical protein